MTTKVVNGYPVHMNEVEVIDDPAAATVALDPIRSRLLAELSEPASAATLAERVWIARQKINYHLRTSEAHGLVTVAKERLWGGLTERLMIATATAYVVSPSAMEQVSVKPERQLDKLSAGDIVDRHEDSVSVGTGSSCFHSGAGRSSQFTRGQVSR